MNRIEKHCHLLINLPKLSKKQQKKLIESLTTDQVKFIVELASNLLFNDIPKINSEAKQKIKKSKVCLRKLRTLASKKISLRKKRDAIITGGFLPMLVSVLGAKAIESLLDLATNKLQNLKEKTLPKQQTNQPDQEDEELES